MTKRKNRSSYDNPFAVNFDPAKFVFAGKHVNAEFFNSTMSYHVETLDFLKKRFEKDMKLASDLSEADAVDEAINCWLDFFRQAQIDYSDEMARLFRINASMAADTAKKVEREARTVIEEYAVATAA